MTLKNPQAREITCLLRYVGILVDKKTNATMQSFEERVHVLKFAAGGTQDLTDAVRAGGYSTETTVVTIDHSYACL